MPLLFTSPRHRATLFAALLLVEFATVLWLRTPAAGDHDEGLWKAVEFPNNPPLWQQPALDTFSSDHLGRRGEENTGRTVDAELAREKSGGSSDKRSRWQIWKSVSSRKLGFQTEDEPRYHHHHRKNHAEDLDHPQIEYNGHASSTTAQPSAPTSVPSGNIEDPTMSKSTSKAKGDSVGARDSMEKEKEAKYKRKEKSSKKTRSKNQQDGSGRKTKTREERKQDQLIPVVDENGVVIEDHFISPRDLDGDGSPDTYVLLRPTDNSKDMLDVGLFDEDVAAIAAVAPAEQKLSSTTLPTPSSSPSHTPILQPPAVVVVPGGQPKPSLEPSATGQPQPDPQPSDLATPSSSPMPESTHDLKVEPDNNAQGPNS